MNKRFSDNALQQIYDEHESGLAEKAARLDQISLNIKQIQEMLNSHPIDDFEFSITIDRNPVKLAYEKGRIISYNGTTIKPLIETKAGFRSKIGRFLPDFLEEALKNLAL